MRRALTDQEIRRLLGVAGPCRIVYLAALLTGLRRGELAQLVWNVVHLDVPTPFLTVRDSIAKNHKEARLQLHPELAAALRDHRPADASPADLVFPKMPSMDKYKVDLKGADIPYFDAEARQAELPRTAPRLRDAVERCRDLPTDRDGAHATLRHEADNEGLHGREVVADGFGDQQAAGLRRR